MSGRGQRPDIVDIEMFELLGDALLELALAQEDTERLGRGGKTVRHPDAGIGELAEHFAQGSVFAADRFDIGHAELAEGNDVASWLHAQSSSLGV